MEAISLFRNELRAEIILDVPVDASALLVVLFCGASVTLSIAMVLWMLFSFNMTLCSVAATIQNGLTGFGGQFDSGPLAKRVGSDINYGAWLTNTVCPGHNCDVCRMVLLKLRL